MKKKRIYGIGLAAAFAGQLILPQLPVMTAAAAVVKPCTLEQFSDDVRAVTQGDAVQTFFGEIVYDPSAGTLSADGSVPDTVCGDLQVRDGKLMLRSRTGSGSKWEPFADAAEESGYSVENDGGTLTITNEFQTARLIVKAEGRIDLHGAESAAEGYRSLHILQYADSAAAYRAYQAYLADPAVEYVQPSHRVSIDETELAAAQQAYTAAAAGSGYNSWGVPMIGTEDFIAQYLDAEKLPEVVVAVLDTGINPAPKLFEGRILDGGVNYSDSGDDTTNDDLYHGTHVTGTICEMTPDNVKILPVKIFDENGDASDEQIYLGIMYALEHKADIINMSFGGLGVSPLEIEAMAVADENGMICCAAAGNNYNDAGYYYPGSIASCITVGAVTKEMKRAPFSNRGKSVDVVAPGYDVLSYVLGSNGERELKNGTSMATPHVTACCALLRSYDKEMAPSRAEMLLRLNAKDLGPAGFDDDFAWGFVNMADFRWDDGICPAPEFSLESGNFGKPVEVSLSVALEDAGIYYTTDGSAPSPENGIHYEQPFTVSETTHVLASAFRKDWIGSAPAEAVYTINGEDVKNAFEVKDGVLTAYRGIRSKVVVPNKYNGKPVTAIAAHAFEKNHFMQEIQVPETVTEIGDAAFADCTELTQIYAKGVSRIGKEAFAGCSMLREAFLSYQFEAAGAEAFRDCAALSKISLPGLTVLPEGLFRNCEMLKKADLPDAAVIGAEAFYGCESLSSLTVFWPQVTEIGDHAFDKCAAWSGDVRLPALEKLGESVFSGASSLRCVMLPERITVLPANTFCACSGLRMLDLPGITKIEPGALAVGMGRIALSTGIDYSAVTEVGTGAFQGFLLGSGFDTVTFASLEQLSERAFAGAYAGGLSLPKITEVPANTFAGAQVDCLLLEHAQTLAAGSVTGCRSVLLSEALKSADADAFGENAWIVSGKPLTAVPDREDLQYCNEPLVMRFSSEKAEIMQHVSGRLRVLACGDGLKYQWYLVSGETQTPVEGAAEPEFVPDTSEPGVYTYRCIMTDAQGKTEQVTSELKVKKAAATETLAPDMLSEQESGTVYSCQITVPESGTYRLTAAGSTACTGTLSDAAGQPLGRLTTLISGGEMLRLPLSAGETYYLRTEAVWSGSYALYLAADVPSETDISACTLKVSVPAINEFGETVQAGVTVRKPDGTLLTEKEDYIACVSRHNHHLIVSVYGIGLCFGSQETMLTVYDKIRTDTPVPVEISSQKEEAVFIFVPQTTGTYQFYASPAPGYAEEQLSYNRSGRYVNGPKYNDIKTCCWVADTPAHDENVFAYSEYSSITKDFFHASVLLHAGQRYYFVCSGSANASYMLVISEEDYDIRDAEVMGSFFASYEEGSTYKPKITVKLGDKVLKENTDYQRIDSRNDIPGKALVTIIGMGLYYGTIQKNYEIMYSEPDEPESMIELDQPAEVASGSSRVTALWFTADRGAEATDTVRYRILNENITGGPMEYSLYRYLPESDSCSLVQKMSGEQNDYLLTNGTYVLTVSPQFPEMYSKANISVLIPYSVTDAEMTITNQTYTGSEVPLPVKLHAEDGTELLPGRDFRIVYKEKNVMFGTVNFTLYSTNRTYGYQEGSFEICVELPEDAPLLEVGSHSVTVTKEDRLAVYRVTAEKEQNYVLCTSDVADVVLRVFSPDTEMLAQDYGAGTKSVEFTVPAGETRYVMVKFNGTAREGTISFRLETELRLLSECEIISDPYLYTGEQATPQIVFKDGDYTLKEGTDYHLRYTADDVMIGTATANYSGIGKYFGNYDVEYPIIPEQLFAEEFFDPQPLMLDESYSVDKNHIDYMVFSYTSGIDADLEVHFYDAECKLSVQCYDADGRFTDSIFFKPDGELRLNMKAGDTVYFLVSATNISSRNQNFKIKLHDNGGETMEMVYDDEGGFGYRVSKAGDYAEAYAVRSDRDKLTLLPEVNGIPVSFVPESLFARLKPDTTVIGYAGCGADIYADRYGFIYQQTPPPEQKPVKGDLNGDGRCSAADLSILLAMLSEHDGPDPAVFPFADADLDGDGILSMSDLRVMQKLIAE